MFPESNRSGRNLSFHVRTAALCLCWTLPLYGQGERPTDLLASVLTWGPVLFIIGVWIFIMKKTASREWKSDSQGNRERMASIDSRLEQIAESLERLVEEMKKGR